MTGWIKLHRCITENKDYFAEPFTRMSAWIDLLILANHKDNSFYVRGNEVRVKRGQIGMSITNLAIRWMWSRGKVIRFLDALETGQQIEQQKNFVTTLISIINYDIYQSDSTADGITDVQQTGSQTCSRRYSRRDTNKNDKNDKNEENIDSGEKLFSPTPTKTEDFEIRKKSFMNDCAVWVSIYSKEMIRAFFDYWTEPNKSKTKMKFELERTWSLERRLRTWENNELKFNKNGNGNNKQRGCDDAELADAIRQGVSRAKYNAANNEG